MLDKEDLQAIAQLMDAKLQPVTERLNHMQEDIDGLKEQLAEVQEDTQVTRGAVNTLLDWADDASIQVVPLLHRKKPE